MEALVAAEKSNFIVGIARYNRRVAFPPYSFLTSKSRPRSKLAARAFLREQVHEERAKEELQLGLADTSLESTLEHRLWVSAGFVSIFATLAKSATAAGTSPQATVAAVLAGAAGYILSDLATGVYHWGIDNYGDATTPVFGPQIDAFQGHHKRPWTITKRQFANNLQAIARPVAAFLLPIDVLTPDAAAADAFLGVFLACVLLSQQFHAWAHTRKSQLPQTVVALQDLGLLVPRPMHGRHHRAPYSSNYCIVSGICNPLLDSTRFFPLMEKAIYAASGVAPRCWDEQPQWAQQGSYFEDP